ncbi:phosphoribosylaminoimidazolesuccinocarboxamide synthase [Candidatus Saccharibacteria bacterium]|nr:phosphoribosylaminoimidazolesuccinocarboxamide synthase [Candidatus Saccharibacteria bacterium]
MSEMEQLPVRLAEGKTKIIWDLPSSGEVMVESKDTITAGNGERTDTIEGKAKLATQTTVNCFKLLEQAGIPTHFVAQEGERLFRAKQVEMIPIELVARRIAFGSYLKRNPDTEQKRKFEDVKFEMFAKDDPNGDPTLDFNFEEGVVSRYKANVPQSSNALIDFVSADKSPFAITSEQHEILEQLTVNTFELLEAAWADQGVTLVDIKIECGVKSDGEIVVADVIDNDSWRIWPGGDPEQMVDKQNYRDGKPLDYVADRYVWVAKATNQFVE